jgi:hypothetical protein
MLLPPCIAQWNSCRGCARRRLNDSVSAWPVVGNEMRGWHWEVDEAGKVRDESDDGCAWRVVRRV